MAQAVTQPLLDVREIPPRERHSRIFATFRALGAGEAMTLVNDHDPRPLYHQFQSEMPGTFTWQYLARGPEVWQVEIVRTHAGPAGVEGACCGGGCGGA
jgi:uncharacterized protein (DUF2249 family)